MKEVPEEEKILIDYLTTRLDRLACSHDPERELGDICYKLRQFRRLNLLSIESCIDLRGVLWSVALDHCIEDFIPEYYLIINKLSGGGRS